MVLIALISCYYWATAVFCQKSAKFKNNNEGWVNIGTDSNTAEFAINSISQWWLKMGQYQYPKTKKLLIIANAGVSNGYKIKLWKYCLWEFAKKFKIDVHVAHFPPGTSKWNYIEHRFFSHISMNWRGKHLESHEVMINLISKTSTKNGLKAKAGMDLNKYEVGKKIDKTSFNKIPIQPNSFHGEWNYTIKQK